MRFCISGSYLWVPDEINKIVINGSWTPFLKCVNSNRRFKEEEKQRDTIQYETDKYGQKQSIKFATFTTPEITRNQDSKVNCVLLGPYMT